MNLQHSQNSPQPQTNTNPVLSQLKSQKTPTHLTIQQENQNNKQAAKPQVNQSKNMNKNPDDKKFRKLSKQAKKVKSLQEEYRQLEEQVREIKELIQLQVQMIDYSTQDINQKYQSTVKQSFKQSLTPRSKLLLSISPLQTCLTKLFSYHQTIQTANSNYLLLSQVNKQEESQNIFHIHNLEERIRQLRFLLNGKQDLLAYETATFQSENVEQDGHDIKKILIDYHLPRKESLGSKNNMESQFLFVQKIVSEMARLRKSVQQLQQQLASDTQDFHSSYDGEKHHLNKKDSVKENDSYPQNSQLDPRYASPKTTRNKQIDHVKLFAQCQNNLLSAQTSRTPQKANSAISQKLHNQKSPKKKQLSLLPLSIQNYKHSLIYRVGKLHLVEQQHSKKLQLETQKLTKQLNFELETKKKLIKQYELKRDIYEYKKKLLNGKYIATAQKVKIELDSKKNQIVSTENILAQLEEQLNCQPETFNTNSPKQNEKHQSNHDIEENSILANENSPPEEIQVQQIKIQPSSKSVSIIDLSSSSPSKEKNLQTPQKQLLFQELTNSSHTPSKRSINNPFLKNKDSDPKRKHFSHQENLSAKTPKKERKVYEDGDKENESQNDPFNLKQSKLSSGKNLDLQSNEKPMINVEIQFGKEPDQQIPNQNKTTRSTLRRRRDHVKKNQSQNQQTVQQPIQVNIN